MSQRVGSATVHASALIAAPRSVRYRNAQRAQLFRRSTRTSSRAGRRPIPTAAFRPRSAPTRNRALSDTRRIRWPRPNRFQFLEGECGQGIYEPARQSRQSPVAAVTRTRCVLGVPAIPAETAAVPRVVPSSRPRIDIRRPMRERSRERSQNHRHHGRPSRAGRRVSRCVRGSSRVVLGSGTTSASHGRSVFATACTEDGVYTSAGLRLNRRQRRQPARLGR